MVLDVERPSDAEMNRLLEKYGRIRRRIVDWDMRHLDERGDWPPCHGEVVLLVRDREGRLVAARKRESEHYQLPMGRIQPGESIEEAARREALEETGWSVEVDEVAALHRVRIHFRAWELERWFFIVLCRPQDDGGTPTDTEEIAEVKLIQLPQELPLEWVRNQWYLWIMKDASLLHPHSFLLGKVPENLEGKDRSL